MCLNIGVKKKKHQFVLSKNRKILAFFGKIFFNIVSNQTLVLKKNLQFVLLMSKHWFKKKSPICFIKILKFWTFF
ncbi:MAG: hypothetical protein B6I24_11115 [Bacteroidetes bacterium 4572_128]|nr:MAG: hypothetical protein B6I24_11115 [Bacteroidetes bacterium 4572_128]